MRQGVSYRERIIDELREFVILSAYLFISFAAISYLKAAILDAQGIAYAPWAFAATKAVIAAKFLLVGRALHIGDRYKKYPLIVPTLFKSFAFLALLMTLMVIEETVVGVIHGRSVPDSISEMAGGTLDQMVATGIITLLILIPYFAFRSLGDVIGDRTLVRLYFEPRSGIARL
jgi:hypothetical protein